MIYFCLDRLALNAVVQGELAAVCGYADQLLGLNRAPDTLDGAEHPD